MKDAQFHLKEGWAESHAGVAAPQSHCAKRKLTYPCLLLWHPHSSAFRLSRFVKLVPFLDAVPARTWHRSRYGVDKNYPDSLDIDERIRDSSGGDVNIETLLNHRTHDIDELQRC